MGGKCREEEIGLSSHWQWHITDHDRYHLFITRQSDYTTIRIDERNVCKDDWGQIMWCDHLPLWYRDVVILASLPSGLEKEMPDKPQMGG